MTSSGISSFDPRSRAGSDHWGTSMPNFHARFRSALPCGERPRAQADRAAVGTVSIRAPVRGATCVARIRRSYCTFRSALPCGERLQAREIIRSHFPVSIRAPVRGATAHTHSVTAANGGFDPRSRAGSDRLSHNALYEKRNL